MNTNHSKLSRGEKILVFLYQYASGERQKIRYEDIVVGLYKQYPQDFHLKGYPEFPDSGDLVHKPLYDFKKRGLVNASNKVFSLTERGAEMARQLSLGKSKVEIVKSSRLSRSTATELSRIKNLEGFSLFVSGDKEKLSDNDFYEYLGVTVRTPKNAFMGRLETMGYVDDELNKDAEDLVISNVSAYHHFLFEKHKDIIEYFTNK